MMLALIKKDLRLYVVPTIGGLVLISCSYFIAAAIYLFGTIHSREDPTDWANIAAYIGLLMVTLLASAYGGSSFAVERREHSSDWLNMLPVTRRQIVASKVVAAFASLTVLSVYDFLPLAAVYSREIWIRYDVLSRQMPPIQLLGNLLAFIFITFILLIGSCWILFAFAWLFSTFLDSAAISACFAIFLVFGTCMTMIGVDHVSSVNTRVLEITTISLLVVAATASFALSTRYYLYRVEP